MNFTFDENEDANEPIQSEDVIESVDNYEDNEFDESSDEEVGLNVVTDETTSDDLYPVSGESNQFSVWCQVRRVISL